MTLTQTFNILTMGNNVSASEEEVKSRIEEWKKDMVSYAQSGEKNSAENILKQSRKYQKK